MNQLSDNISLHTFEWHKQKTPTTIILQENSLKLQKTKWKCLTAGKQKTAELFAEMNNWDWKQDKEEGKADFQNKIKFVFFLSVSTLLTEN